MPETNQATQSKSAARPGKSKSKVLHMTPSDTKATPTPVTVEKVYKYFDLNTFNEVSEKASVTFTPPADYAEAMTRIGNDSGVVLKAVSAFLQRAAFNEKRKEIASKGASKKIVLGVIKPLRNLPPWSQMGETKLVDGKQEFVIDRKAQTESLLQMVKANAVMVEAIKNASIAAAEADDDEDESDASE